MHAQVGDRLLAAPGSGRVGLIVGVLGDDGQPPYVVKWQRTGHLAMVFPDPYARIIPAGHPAGTQGGWAAGGLPPPEPGGQPKRGE
jgi:Domain of unknown function (DUF1918)